MRKALILVVGLLIVSCAKRPQLSYNYLQNSQGQRVSWKSDVPVDLIIHKSFYDIDPNNPEVGEGYIQLVREASGIWARRAGVELFNIVEDKNHEVQQSNEVTSDEYSVIHWIRDWDGNSSEQARTSTRWIGAEIVEADVSINNQNHTFYHKACIEEEEEENKEENSEKQDSETEKKAKQLAEQLRLVDTHCSKEKKPVIDEDDKVVKPDEKSMAHFVSLMIHELGHVLGQSHEKQVASVMQPMLRSTEFRDVIFSIDRDRILIEYGI